MTVRRLHVISGAVAALLVSAACSRTDSPTVRTFAPTDLPIARELQTAQILPLKKLAIPTPDGTGDAVHPSIVYFPESWHGWKYWMAMTPYYGSSGKVENPSLLVSNDGLAWQLPGGATNPIIATPNEGYNSDPDLAYNARENRLELRWRIVTGNRNVIAAMASADGVQWSERHILFAEQSHDAVSPTWVGAQGQTPQTVWYVKAHTGCGTPESEIRVRQLLPAGSVAPDSSQWGPLATADLQQYGLVIWHLAVRQVPGRNQYWAVYPAYNWQQMGCGSDDLYFARSDDGVHWTSYPLPILNHVALGLSSLYRTDFLYDPATDHLQLWVSAMDRNGRWAIYYTAFNYSAMSLALSRSKGLDPNALRPELSRKKDVLLLKAP